MTSKCCTIDDPAGQMRLEPRSGSMALSSSGGQAIYTIHAIFGFLDRILRRQKKAHKKGRWKAKKMAFLLMISRLRYAFFAVLRRTITTFQAPECPYFAGNGI